MAGKEPAQGGPALAGGDPLDEEQELVRVLVIERPDDRPAGRGFESQIHLEALGATPHEARVGEDWIREGQAEDVFERLPRIGGERLVGHEEARDEMHDGGSLGLGDVEGEGEDLLQVPVPVIVAHAVELLLHGPDQRGAVQGHDVSGFRGLFSSIGAADEDAQGFDQCQGREGAATVEVVDEEDDGLAAVLVDEPLDEPAELLLDDSHGVFVVTVFMLTVARSVDEWLEEMKEVKVMKKMKALESFAEERQAQGTGKDSHRRPFLCHQTPGRLQEGFSTPFGFSLGSELLGCLLPEGSEEKRKEGPFSFVAPGIESDG